MMVTCYDDDDGDIEHAMVKLDECVGTTETLLLIRIRIGCNHRSISLGRKLQLCKHVCNLAYV